jgi:hypothetical protein
MSPRPNIKDGSRWHYLTRYGRQGVGRVIEVYQKLNGWWMAIDDRKAKRTVEVRPGQMFRVSAAPQPAAVKKKRKPGTQRDGGSGEEQ